MGIEIAHALACALGMRLSELVREAEYHFLNRYSQPGLAHRKYSQERGKIFHDFRRTASRNMIAAGVPQAVAMKITGHRTDSMFRRYAIVDEEQKRDALAKTQQYLVASAAARKVVRMGGGR